MCNRHDSPAEGAVGTGKPVVAELCLLKRQQTEEEEGGPQMASFQCAAADFLPRAAAGTAAR